MSDYIVLDLEWNQALKGRELKDMPFEIIEIGAVRLDENKNETDSFDMLIHPREYKTMHYLNAKIVNITTQELADKPDFKTVYREFIKWLGKSRDYIFCTWGDMDLTELQRNIRHFKCRELSDGPIRFLDIQKLYAIHKGDVKVRTSLETAVDELGLKQKYPFHRAINDVRYTADVFKRIADPALEKKVSYNLFHTPKDKESEIYAYFDTYSKYVSRSFKGKTALHGRSEVWCTDCYICKKKTVKKIDWFTSNNGKTYLSLAECPEHGLLRSVVRIKKAEIKGIYAIRITHSASEEDIEQMMEKYNKVKNDQKSNLSNSE